MTRKTCTRAFKIEAVRRLKQGKKTALIWPVSSVSQPTVQARPDPDVPAREGQFTIQDPNYSLIISEDKVTRGMT